MFAPTLEDRTLTELDHVRLERLIGHADRARDSLHTGPISALLDAAQCVPSRAVAPDVVTMYTQVQLADVDSGRRYTLTLCYPADAEPASGFISVLSPVGAALLGLRMGEIARWRGPAGDAHAAEVVALLFQPEASGDYTL